MGSRHWRDQVNSQASAQYLWECNCGQVQLPGRLAGGQGSRRKRGRVDGGWEEKQRGRGEGAQRAHEGQQKGE